MYPAVTQDDVLEVIVPKLEGKLAERVKGLVAASSKLQEESYVAILQMNRLAEDALASSLREGATP
jgi:hypothetical protein